MNKQKGLAPFCAVVLSLLLVACAAGGQGADRGADIERTGVRDADRDDMRYQWNDGDNNISRQNPNIRVGDPNPRTLNADARRMEEAAEKVEGVEEATVVIAGGNALVRIDIDRDLDRAQARAIEEEVERRLFALVPRYEFRVTTDGEMFDQLRNR